MAGGLQPVGIGRRGMFSARGENMQGFIRFNKGMLRMPLPIKLWRGKRGKGDIRDITDISRMRAGSKISGGPFTLLGPFSLLGS